MNRPLAYGCTAILMVQLMIGLVARAELDAVEESVLSSRSARIQATIDADIDTLGEYLADELSYSHTTGWSETRSEFLSTVETATIDYISVTPIDTRVRVYGDMAVTTGSSHMQGTVNGEPVSLTIRFLEVSRRVGDSWRLVAYQSVRLTAE